MEQKKKVWGIFLLPLTWGRLWSDSSTQGETEKPRQIKYSFTLCPFHSSFVFCYLHPPSFPQPESPPSSKSLTLYQIWERGDLSEVNLHRRG